jgi:excisionase family DNA binding protein
LITPLPPLLLTLDEAAKQLRCSHRTVQRMVERGLLTATGYGRGRRVTMRSLHAYIEEAERDQKKSRWRGNAP